MRIIFIISLLFIFCKSNCSSQHQKLDSLKSLLKFDKADTIKLRHLYQISDECETISEYESGIFYGNKGLQLAEELIKGSSNKYVIYSTKKYQAKIYSNFGIIHHNLGNFPLALQNFQNCLKIKQKIRSPNGQIGDKKGISDSYNNIGIIFKEQGNFPEALKYYFRSLKMRESINDKTGVAASYNNIGVIYYAQGNLKEALKYYSASLKIEQKIGDTVGMASSYCNIGIVNYDNGQYDTALNNQLRALQIYKSLGMKYDIADVYSNIGNVYYAQSNNVSNKKLRRLNLDSSLANHFASLKIRTNIGDKTGIAASYGNIGVIYAKLKKYGEAETYLNNAKNIALEIKYIEYLINIYKDLSELYYEKQDYKAAFENHKLHIIYRDSLNNEQTRKNTIQTQMTYEFEKKEAVAKAEHKKELQNQKVLANEKSRKQTIVILFVVCGLLLVVIFAGFIFRSLRKTKKQKKIIEEQKLLVEQQKHEVELQKNLVEEKQKEVMDSIRYAKRIQLALLPTSNYIDRNLKNLTK